MKENIERKTRGFSRKIFQFSMNESLQSLVSGIYAILHIQFTKISKEKHYYMGTNLEEIKKVVQKKSTRAAKFTSCENSQPCEISQGLRNFVTIAKLPGLLASSLHYLSSSNF